LFAIAFVEAMTEAYPTLEILQVTTHRHQTIPPDHQAILPSFCFLNLTFLSLSNFQLLDGAALIPVKLKYDFTYNISLLDNHLYSPNVRSLYRAQSFKSFTWKLILWIHHLSHRTWNYSSVKLSIYGISGKNQLKCLTILKVKTKTISLFTFRFQWSHKEDVHTSSVFSSLKALLIGSDCKEDVYPATFFSILKALLKGSVQLERVALVDAGSGKLPDWKHPPEFVDFLVDFVTKMTHLTCCCLTFNQLGVKLTKEIKPRVEKEVVTDRPSLWFHLDRVLPEASDPGVPAIHYHQIVHPISFFIPRF